MSTGFTSPSGRKDESPSGSPSAPSVQRSSGAGGPDRGSLRAASYAEGASLLAPVQALKYEQSVSRLAPAGGIVQFHKEGEDAAAPAAGGMESYSISGASSAQTVEVTDEEGNVAKQNLLGPDDEQLRTGPGAGGWASGGGYNTRAVGVGGGDRRADRMVWADAAATDPSKTPEEQAAAKAKGKVRAGEEIGISAVASGAYKPNLRGILSEDQKNKTEYGGGLYTSTEAGWGTAADGKWGSVSRDTKGKTSVKGPSARAAAGGTARAAAGWAGETEGALGKGKAGVEAYGEAWLGADVNAGITDKGASLSGGVGLGAQAGVKGSADYTTPGLEIDGVSKPLDAGVGVSGEAYVAAKAGAGGGLYLTKDKVGAAGSAGVFLGGELKGEVHGHIGPVAASYEASALAGVGAGVEGSILYEDGKLVIGGRIYAAMGYGAKTGGKITIDVAQSVELAAAALSKAKEMGVEAADAAFRAADADMDGRLSTKDAALHMKNAGDSADQGAKDLVSYLDQDGSGDASLGDVAAFASKGADAVGKRVDSAVEGAKQLGSDIYDAGAAGLEKAGQALDATVQATVTRGRQAIADAGQLLEDGQALAAAAADRAAELVEQARNLTAQDVADGAAAAGQAVYDGAASAGKAVYDGGAAAVDAVVDAGSAAKEWAGDQATAAGKAIKHGADVAGDAAFNLLNRDGDDNIDWNDAKAGLAQADKAVKDTAAAAAKQVHETGAAVAKAVTELPGQAKAAVSEAKKTVRATAKSTLDAASSGADWVAKQGSAALDSAEKTVQQTVARGREIIDAASKITTDDVAQAASAAAAKAKKLAGDAAQSVSTGLANARASISEGASNLAQGARDLGSGVSSGLSTIGNFIWGS